MSLWVKRYLTFLAGLLAGFLAIRFANALLGVVITLIVGDTKAFYRELVERAVLEGGLSITQYLMYYYLTLFGLYLVAGVLAFRWVAAIGWRCRMLLRHAALCWCLFVGLIALLNWTNKQGVVTDQEGWVIFCLVVLTLGFRLHVWIQRAAGEKARASADRERVNAFA